MGFQYELSEQFAKSLGVKLRVVVARNVQGLIRKLLAGEVVLFTQFVLETHFLTTIVEVRSRTV